MAKSGSMEYTILSPLYLSVAFGVLRDEYNDMNLQSEMFQSLENKIAIVVIMMLAQIFRDKMILCTRVNLRGRREGTKDTERSTGVEKLQQTIDDFPRNLESRQGHRCQSMAFE